MTCPDCAALADEVARLTARVDELEARARHQMHRERTLSMALAQAPQPGEKIRDGPGYGQWFWGERYMALHDTDTPSRRLTEPPSYAATMLPRKHGHRRD